ncbi:MAG: transcriptional regulator [Bacteroidaceae bacterium]|nr:transcriptional regulator [Bacteroidaceae bacterium]
MSQFLRPLCLLFALIVASVAPASPINPPLSHLSLPALLDSLDAVILRNDEFVAMQRDRIQQLRQRFRSNAKPEERYALNSLMYDEFYVLRGDSAMSYVERNLAIARALGRPDWEAEWHIKRSFVLAVQGMLKEAEQEIAHIRPAALSNDLRVEYYRQKIYIFSHYNQYYGDNAIARSYYDQEVRLRDSICSLVEPSDPLYLWQKAWGDDPSSVKDELTKRVNRSNLSTRLDAMNAYCLAYILRQEGHDTEADKWLAISAICDVRSNNADIASLEELSIRLYHQGQIDRSYNYMSFCIQKALSYPNRVRIVSLSNVFDGIRAAYMAQSKSLQSRSNIALVALSIVALGLVLLAGYAIWQMRRIRVSRSHLNAANQQLGQHIAQLDEARAQLAEANHQLSEANRQLAELNAQLRESNFVKEETVGYVFSICSSYITKLEDYRLRIHRQVKTGQIDELRRSTEHPITTAELKAFFHTFDQVFLNIYPDFVQDFNALLRPEEQIVPKEGELLNTDLRIYALVRLGITDSVKIADFLHCSVQTVYNNRLRVRNKSLIPKTEFAQTVQQLGKEAFASPHFDRHGPN